MCTSTKTHTLTHRLTTIWYFMIMCFIVFPAIYIIVELDSLSAR